MKRFNSTRSCIALMLCFGVCAGNVALAAKPAWKEGGKHQKHADKAKSHPVKDSEERRYDEPRRHLDGNTMDRRVSGYFNDRHRSAVRKYYADPFQSGHCPPGLAKKQNGCLPPGQAKKWSVGRPLPHDVIYHDLPQAIALSIGPPPAGYRFVRVASDILMIAVGTGMVMDAISDLGGM